MKSLKEYLLKESQDIYYIVPVAKIEENETIEEWVGPYSYKDEAEEDADIYLKKLKNENIDIIAMKVLNASQLISLLKKYQPNEKYSEDDIENMASSKRNILD